MRAHMPNTMNTMPNLPNNASPMPRDPFGSMQGFIQQFTGFMQNPAQMLGQKLGLQGNDPSQMIQQLMNSGKMSQNDYNQLQNIAKQIQNNPMFSHMFRR